MTPARRPERGKCRRLKNGFLSLHKDGYWIASSNHYVRSIGEDGPRPGIQEIPVAVLSLQKADVEAAVERMAQAQACCDQAHWDNLLEPTQTAFRESARAALEALCGRLPK
jgi:hypothetical protein